MTEDKQKKQNYTRRFVLVLRILVGSVFAFSGFVKAIDPWGVFYKFEDYVSALGWEWLSPFLAFGAFAVSVFEFVLGVILIVGAYRRFSSWLALALMTVMTPLTLWLALTGSVADCGCFGDAVVLSNWATFWKNIVLLAAVIYLLLFNVRVGNLYSPGIQWIVTTITLAFVIVVACYGYFVQPMIDFRPYKIGKELIPITDTVDEDFVFVYEKGGVREEFGIDEIPNDSTWNFVERRDKKTQNVDSDTGGNLVLRNNDEDVTWNVLKQEGEQIVLVFSDMEDIDITYTYLINIIDDFARKSGVDIIGATGAGTDEIEEWNDLSMAAYPIYNADDTELKMLARGNPAVVYLRDGKVVWKRTLQSISAARVDAAMNGEGDFMWIADDFDGEERLKWLVTAYVTAMLLILILNRSYRVYKFSARLMKKNRK